MKTRISLLIALAGFALTTFGQGNKTALCKKWKIDVEAFIADMPPEMTAMMDMMPAEQKKMALDQMKQNMQSLYVQFNADGTMSSNSSEQGLKNGTWKYVDNGSAIWSKVDGRETVLELVELTPSKMRVAEKNPKTGQQMIMTFVPFKD